EPPLPSFEGVTLDGKPFAATDLIGRRSLLFVFDPAAAEAPPAAEAIARIAGLRGENNFDIAGIATGSSPSAVRAFASKYGLAFRVVDVASRETRARVGPRAPVALSGVAPEGYLVFYPGGASPPDVPDAAPAAETQLRESLRLPPAKLALEPTLGTRPTAPL